MFKSARDASNPDNGLAARDYFPTTLTTRGYLSDGISVGNPATLYGGAGNDSFNVYRNLAELYLYGDEDNDTFRIRAFVKVDPNDPKAPYTNINGGQGADFISYTVNSPVRIEGGDGLDTLTVIGTEFGDDFIVTDRGIFGAGLYVTYAGIEQTVVDGLEGNDTFFIASTDENVDTQVYGGLGSDTFQRIRRHRQRSDLRGGQQPPGSQRSHRPEREQPGPGLQRAFCRRRFSQRG